MLRTHFHTHSTRVLRGTVSHSRCPRAAGLAAHVLFVPAEVESDILRRVRTLLRELDGHHPACQCDRGETDPDFPPGYCLTPNPTAPNSRWMTGWGDMGWPLALLCPFYPTPEVVDLQQAPGVCRAQPQQLSSLLCAAAPSFTPFAQPANARVGAAAPSTDTESPRSPGQPASHLRAGVCPSVPRGYHFATHHSAPGYRGT